MKIRLFLLVQLVSLLALSKSAAGAEQGQIVIEDLSIGELRQQIDRVQKEFYRVYNTLNEDDDFDITCHRYTPTGSNISREACEPNFLISRRSDNAKENQQGTDVLVNQEALIQQLQPEFEKLTERMNAVGKESEYFRELNQVLGMLRERLTELTGS
ncbi:MAG: hypothetical protein R3F41_11780 [Gammaproteobacteria bacterium]|nr:hypothetical protein [Pseudomonadales bacterium]MCP5348293.1 hypothetical protein [Pseudomonadales bacterium]